MRTLHQYEWRGDLLLSEADPASPATVKGGCRDRIHGGELGEIKGVDHRILQLIDVQPVQHAATPIDEGVAAFIPDDRPQGKTGLEQEMLPGAGAL